MKRILALLALVAATPAALSSQTLSAPEAQGVYGGTVQAIATAQTHSDTTLVVLASESPNSLFYGKAYRGSGMYWQDSLRTVPSADSDDGFGASIEAVEIHSASGTIFFLYNSYIYSTTVTAASATKVDSLVKSMLLVNDTLFTVKNGLTALGQNRLGWSPVSSSGSLGTGGTISLLKTYTDPPQLLLNPSTKKLQVYDRGQMPHLYTVNDAYYAMSSSTGLSSAVNPVPTGTAYSQYQWRTYGFADDGTWYVAGNANNTASPSLERKMAWSSNNGMSWTVVDMDAPGPPGGALAEEMVIQSSGSGRHVTIGSLTTKDNGTNWNNPGFTFLEKLNRANDGAIAVDLIDTDVKYHATNVGFGFSTDSCANMYDWNPGFEAVRVNDIDMTPSFATGWVASKSGIRKVSGYKSGAPVWSDTQFPNGDGSPYYSVGIDPSDSLKVFVGNIRVYRTTDDGMNWTQVFDPGNAPLNYSRFGTEVTAVKVCPWNSNHVIATLRNSFGQHDGGTFASNDGGTNWSQVLLGASTPGYDVNCNDVIFALEGTDTVAYIATEPQLTAMGPPSGVGMYKLTLGSSGWSSAVDGTFGATDYNMDMVVSGDSLYVLNGDPGVLPVFNVAIKDLSTNTWSTLPGPNAGGDGTAITVGDGYVFVAMNEIVYTLDLSNPTAGWSVGHAYPAGTYINVLFYDELLVGTGTGLYAHDLATNIGLDEFDTAPVVDIHPNPFSTELLLHEPSPVTVTNLHGQVVFSSNEPTSRIETSAWPAGVYVIRTPEAQSKVLKLK